MTSLNNAETIFPQLISAISLMMDLDENRKLYHAWRVAAVAVRMAEKIIPEFAPDVFYAALLHDVGGIALEDHMVHHPLFEEHFKNPMILAHPKKGAAIIGGIPGLKTAAAMVADHHERWDGSGYPAGKSGGRISIGGQILRTADAFDLTLRAVPFRDVSRVVASLYSRVGREYSSEMFALCYEVIKDINFYFRVAKDEALFDVISDYLNKLPRIRPLDSMDLLDKVLDIFAEIIDAKHHYTAGHSSRVGEYSAVIARAFGYSESDVKKIKFAGFLHDAGKVAVPPSILDKPSPLTQKEYEIIKKHPVNTMEIISLIQPFHELVPIAGHHHERYDGTGYPNGLAGSKIPFEARIMAVADAFDAMTSLRPYSRPKTVSQAKQVMLKESGTQFDPNVVAVACKVL